MMNRRAFVITTVGLLAAPLDAQAQPGGKVYRIGSRIRLRSHGSAPDDLFWMGISCRQETISCPMAGDRQATLRWVADTVDKILRGTKAGDIRYNNRPRSGS